MCEIVGVCECELYVWGRRREEEEEPGIQNQKQEPHTKMWGKKCLVQQLHRSLNQKKCRRHLAFDQLKIHSAKKWWHKGQTEKKCKTVELSIQVAWNFVSFCPQPVTLNQNNAKWNLTGNTFEKSSSEAQTHLNKLYIRYIHVPAGIHTHIYKHKKHDNITTNKYIENM